MEQPNGMAGNMMPQNMSMQRPQQGNQTQQLYAMIMQRLKATKPQLGQGWQATFDVQQRAVQIFQMVTALRMLGQGDAATCLNIAHNFEIKIIIGAQTQQEYEAHMRNKLNEIKRKREESVANAAQAQLGMQMQPNMGAPNNNGMNNFPMNGMSGMNMPNDNLGMPNGPNGQQNPAVLAHLQRPMQPSPIPPQQEQPITLDPTALQNNGMPPQMPNMNGGMPRQPNPGAQLPNTINEQQELMGIVMALFNQLPESQRDKARQSYLATMPEHERVAMEAKKADPLFRALLPRARTELNKRKAAQQQKGNGMQMSSDPPQPSGLPNGGLDFSALMAQQSHAMQQANAGDQVVPASNNNFSTNGVPQNINPQMLGNQNGQQGNNNNAQLQQLLMQQQQHQQQQQQQRVQQNNMNMIAQRQAMQQVNQLRGQPGGLNAPNALNGGPAGQVPSPAMSMLNRPMVPPGQAAPPPGTPQPNRPQQQPPATSTGAAQLMQHWQQMMSQNNQGSAQQVGPPQPQPQPQRPLPDVNGFLSNPQIRAKLAGMPNEHRARLIAGLKAGQHPQDILNRMQNEQNQGQMPGNMNMPGGAQQGQGQGQMSGLPQNIPQFNVQPPSFQQPPPQQMDQMPMQQRMQQQPPSQPPNQQLQSRAMDIRPFPQQLLHQLGVAVPEGTKLWFQLKQHIQRHQSQNILPPNTMMKVQNAQRQWFEAHPDELAQGIQQIRLQMQRTAQHNAQANQQHQASHMPNGQAPPAQMVPPAAPMQAPGPNNGNGAQGMMQAQQPSRPIPPPNIPTQAEIQQFRNNNAPHSANMSDEQIRDHIWKRRRDNHAKQLSIQQQQEALKHAQRTQQQGQGGPSQPGPTKGPPQQRGGLGNQTQGQKRSQQNADDEVMEIPNPNAPLQAPAMQGSHSQQMNMQLPRGMNQDQREMFMKMQPEQREKALRIWESRHRDQAEAIKKAQMGLAAPAAGQGRPPNPPQALPTPPIPQGINMGMQHKTQVVQRIQMMYQEVERQNPKGPAVAIDDDGLQQAQNMLKRLWQPMMRMHSTFVLASQIPGFETRLRAAMKAKIMISQNVVDENGAINGYLSLGINDLRNLEGLMHAYFKEIKNAKERMDATRIQQSQQQAQQQTNAAQQPVPVPPQQPRAPSVSGKPQSVPHQAPPARSKSNAKAPPAPTEQKTFDWNTAGQGLPKYESNGRKELTPDKLKFPPSKKRRTGQPESQESTPAAQMGTPNMPLPSPGIPGVKPSPDQSRKPQVPTVKQEADAMIKCSDPACDRFVKGFESEDQLRKHEAEEHMPVGDPLEFLLDSAAHALGVDKEGKALPPPKQANVKPAPRATPVPGKPSVKRGTPGIKQESATPQAAAAKAQGKSGPVAGPAPEAPAKEKTVRELLEEQMGFVPAAKPSPPQENAATQDGIDFSDMLQDTFGGTDDFGEWTDGLAGVTDWGLRPEQQESSPELTPPSDAPSLSSRSSDVSQSERLRINFEWDPFNNGDVMVPDVLKMQTLGLTSPESGDKAGGEEDAEMADAGDKNGDGARKDEIDEWDWSGDERTDWNTLFGANAGLEDMDVGLGF